MNQYIKTLRRRRNWLQSQVDSTRSDLGYTKSEIAALDHALASMDFVKNGFYEILMDKDVNLTAKQIIRLEKLKVNMIKDELYRQRNGHTSADNG